MASCELKVEPSKFVASSNPLKNDPDKAQRQEAAASS